MADFVDQAYAVTSQLVGPQASVPWWVWPAVLAMIFWGLLVPDRTDPRDG